ncbi:MAG: efflux RND transporter periplasmic adaptor subunit [Cyanobacteria bacterium J06639_16]
MSNSLLSKQIHTRSKLGIVSHLHRQFNRYPRLLISIGTAGLLLTFAVPIVKTQLAPAAESTATNGARVLPVEMLTVETVSSYEVSRAYTGEIAALRSSDLGFERGGQLVEVTVQEGDRVTAGTPLARLDTSNLQTERQQLEAEKAEAMAQLNELQTGPRSEDIAAAEAAVRDLEQQLALQQTQRSRREALYTEGAISREELDEFAFGQGSLEARLDQTRSNLRELRNGTRQEQIAAQQARVQQLDARIANVDVNIRKSTITAPFDGIISTRQIDEGTVVSSGQSVVRLVENAAPEARIGMPTDTVNQLQAGNTQILKLGSETYSATVVAILPEVDAETRTQIVVFRLAEAVITNLSPGQTARVEMVDTIPADGVWLPTEALTQGIRGLWNCYMLVQSDDNNPDHYEVQPQAVEIIHQEAERVLVRGTLQSGDRIVANGTHRLVPGQQVQPL